MKLRIIAGIILIVISNSIAAQFVGDAAVNSTTQTADYTQPAFTLKFGAALPSGNFKTVPSGSSSPQYPLGIMGAKTGFFVETGIGMDLTNPDKPVGFYYYPVLASFWQNSLDWSELGGIFSAEEVYTKPVRILDIAQRYGIAVRPVDKLSMALYYRPGLIIPFKFEITDNPGSYNTFLFTGEMSVNDQAPALMMSHTVGFSVRYEMVSVSLERYSAKPTYDIQYINTLSGVNISEMCKIPVKMYMLSVALEL